MVSFDTLNTYLLLSDRISPYHPCLHTIVTHLHPAFRLPSPSDAGMLSETTCQRILSIDDCADITTLLQVRDCL